MLLPNLRKLKLVVLDGDHSDLQVTLASDNARLLMAKSIQDLHVEALLLPLHVHSFTDAEQSLSRPGLSVLRHIPTLCPGLRHFDAILEGNFDLRHYIKFPCVGVLKSFKLQLKHMRAHCDALHILGQEPNLTSVTLTDLDKLHGELDDMSNEEDRSSGNVDEGLFPHLETLSTSSRICLSLLQARHALRAQLRRLEVGFSWSDGLRLRMKAFMELLPDCSLLSHLTLTSKRHGLEDLFHDNHSDRDLDRDAENIEPVEDHFPALRITAALLKLGRIEEVLIDLDGRIVRPPSDEDFAVMNSSWPALTSVIWLCQGAPKSQTRYPLPSLAALGSLAHCRFLQQAGIPIDTTHDVEPISVQGLRFPPGFTLRVTCADWIYSRDSLYATSACLRLLAPPNAPPETWIVVYEGIHPDCLQVGPLLVNG